MRHLLIAALLDAAATGAAAQQAENGNHLAEAGDVRVLHAWTRATEEPNARVYLAIENQGEDSVTLTGAETEIAALVTLVADEVHEGDLTPATVNTIPVAPGTAVALEPGGLSVMLSELSRPLQEGDRFGLELGFRPIGDVGIEVEVLNAGATQHPHAGYSH